MRRIELPPPRWAVSASRSGLANGNLCFARQTSIVTDVSDVTQVAACAAPRVTATSNGAKPCALLGVDRSLGVERGDGLEVTSELASAMHDRSRSIAVSAIALFCNADRHSSSSPPLPPHETQICWARAEKPAVHARCRWHGMVAGGAEQEQPLRIAIASAR